MVSPTSCSRFRFPFAVENAMDCTAFGVLTATMGNELFDVAFDYSRTGETSLK